MDAIRHDRHRLTRTSSTSSTRASGAIATSTAGALLTTLTGAESALVVNNNAAAVLLVARRRSARDKEVIISRGELIEIGGEFRIPDVMTTSGARLVEVGTTNRTHLARLRDERSRPNTAAILKVHPSNYQVVGFTSTGLRPSSRDSGSGPRCVLIHDVGSGLIEPPREAAWATAEPSIRVALEDGADLVTFSGDKLLGGPQAGVIVGRGGARSKLEKHPLMRALRVDKVTLAALEATADAYLGGEWDRLPFVGDGARSRGRTSRTRGKDRDRDRRAIRAGREGRSDPSDVGGGRGLRSRFADPVVGGRDRG